MYFHSHLFLFGFLPVVVAGYWLLSSGARRWWLLAASVVFYGWADWRFLALLVGMTVLSFAATRGLMGRDSARVRRLGLALAFGNLVVLGVFKYYDLFATTLNDLVARIGLGPLASVDKLPKLLIVPMSVELVRPNLPTGFEPHNPLRPYLERGSRDLLEGARWLFTLEQTRASLRLLAAEKKGRPPSHYRFDADGWGRFAESDAPLEKIVDAYLATKEWGPGLYGFHELDETQISYFQRFLTLAGRLDIRVIVYMPPLYPRAVAFYERETNLPALRTTLLEHLRAWQAEGLIAAVYDFTYVESFGGDASEFHDLAHPTAAASRRMLDLMLRPLPAGS